MIQNIFLPFWKVLDYACQIKIVETLVCLMLTSEVELAFRSMRFGGKFRRQ